MRGCVNGAVQWDWEPFLAILCNRRLSQGSPDEPLVIYTAKNLARSGKLSRMTKSDLIGRLAQHHPQLVQKDAEYSMRIILDAMAAALGQGHRIEIRGFGSFDVNYRRPRVGRNPKSGERVPVPAKHVPHFRPGKELRERVDCTEGAAKPR